MDRLALIVADPVKAMLIKIWSYVPTLLGAILILVIGWLIAKVLESVVVRVLKAIQLDVASDKAGIANIMAQGDIKMSLSEVIGALVYWVVVLVVIATALNALNLTVAADILARLVAYVPNILIAIFILVLGSLLASFIAAIVRTSASNAGIARSKMLAQITQTVLVVFTVIIAIEQLQIRTALIEFAITIFLASIGLGIAIAFGLGCKDIVGKFIAELVEKMKK